ncbi:VWA domain-containing protein [Gemmobacter lanyuensis]
MARAPLNIALAIDVSGSMSGARLEAAKKAAVGLAAQLTEQDRLSLVSFGSDVVVHLDAVTVHAGTLPMIRQTIEALETSGMTNLSDGWFTAVDCAARIAERDPRMTLGSFCSVMVMRTAALRKRVNWGACSSAPVAGVLTSALGIGDDYDEHLCVASLKAVADVCTMLR